MIRTEPKVYAIAGMRELPGMAQYLTDIGMAESWKPNSTSFQDKLAEFAGRLCYKSWAVGLNPNVTRIREDSGEYLGNILSSKHGAVIEHPTLTVLFANVSRVFTHELVRHRAGWAYSQESLRFVRFADAGIPFGITGNMIKYGLVDFYIDCVQTMEGWQKKLLELSGFHDGMSFAEKKELSSMFRRLLPIGLSTNILATGNMRAWRHVLTMRGAKAAEEEMRTVMPQLVSIVQTEMPLGVQDMIVAPDGCISFANEKV